MNDNEQKIIFDNEIKLLLTEIHKWLRFLGIEVMHRKMIKEKNELFADETEIIIYHNSDGEKSSRDLSKMIGNVSHGKVQSLWKKWIDNGIAEATEKYGGGRCKKIFELNELGLELPKTKNKKD